MKKIMLATILLSATAPTVASAKGCIRGALAGGVAGHYVGKGHAVAGAIGGCFAGRAYYKHKAKVAAQQRAAVPAHR